MIAKCGTAGAEHILYTINGVATCVECGAKFIDGIKQNVKG